MVTIADALALSGCSKSNESASTTSAGPTNSTVDIRKSGKLVVRVTIPYTDGKIVGFDVDLINAVAATLGLTADYRESDFAKIIPSIEGGTFDVGMSSSTDTREREQQVDFVT